MNPTQKNIMYTLLYYAGVFVIYIILVNISAGGPCAPSAVIFLLPLVPLVSLGLLINNLILVLHKKPGYIGSVIIHLSVVIGIISFFMFAWG